MTGFERDAPGDVTSGACAIIIAPEIGGQVRSSAARVEEARGLALAIGLEVVETHSVKIRNLRPATLFGSGQIEDIATRVRAHEATLVYIDGALTAVQQRNLEKAWNAKVIDRTGLILEIFGERAATAEGRLQVELAHLDYQAGRLVRSWTHLERQRGGFGFLGGPGETQIEADRRLIRDRMAKIRRELETVTRTRGLHRARRQKAPWPVVALVGYTNAGKSTLFNRLTGADVKAEDMLFATLDPTMRSIELPGLGKTILSDTVGFVSDLPTQLIAAFRATLEEVISADLILHVRDISHAQSDEQASDVLAVLAEIGIGGEGSAPHIEVWNKLDLLSDEARLAFKGEAARRDDVVMISAQSGVGCDTLAELLTGRLAGTKRLRHLALDPAQGDALSWLHANGLIESEAHEGDGFAVTVRLSDKDLARFQARFGQADAK